MILSRNKRRKILIITIICGIYSLLISSPVTAGIIGPEVKIQDNDIIVSTGFSNIKEIETAIKAGIEKEIIFTIELFRVWRFWPDEFMVLKKIQRIIKYDNLRGHYMVSSYDGTSLKEKQFKDFNTLKEFTFTVKDISLANIKELEEDKYLIRVVVESKSRKLPPLIGFFMVFIPETEISMVKKSPLLTIGYKR